MSPTDHQLEERRVNKGRSERRHRDVTETAILESMPDGVMTFDPAWRITYVNSAAEQLNGMARQGLVGRNHWEAFPATIGTLVEREFRRAMSDRVTVRFESLDEASGRWFEVDACPMPNGGLAVYGRDVTTRKRVEEQLAYHTRLLENVHDAISERTAQLTSVNAEYACLLENIHDAVIATDDQFVLTAWNKGAEQMYGWTADEVLGRRVWEVVPSDLTDEQRAEARRQFAKTGRRHTEVMTYRKDGTPVPVDGRSIVLRGEQGQVSGYLDINHDITERKRSEEALSALHEAQAEIAHAGRLAAIGELTASLAHELSQPLAAIATQAGACLAWLGADTPDLEEARAGVQQIIRDAERGGQAVDQTRRLARKSTAEKTAFDINDAISEVLVFIDAPIRDHRITVRKSLAGEVPLVSGIRIQIQQVVLNLALNAIDAMEHVSDGRRELAIRSERVKGAEGDSVLVALQDTGKGFPEQDLPRLFDAFYTTKADGLGLGLSISQSIIAGHGGRLWATRNDEGGATFQFVVPTGLASL
jgi:PAS domain S-box-containing protein